MSYFKEDLKRANVIESKGKDIVCEYYKNKGWTIEHVSNSIGKDSSKDMTLQLVKNGKKFNSLHEFKEDFRCWETGNIAIEIACRGKDSGLTVTKSNFWNYFVHTGSNEACNGIICLQIATSKLKEFVKKYSTKKGGESAEFYVIPLKDVLACNDFERICPSLVCDVPLMRHKQRTYARRS